MKSKSERMREYNAICGDSKHLGIDHDHGTGKVRGLLCRDCNQGIGRFHDNPAILRKAADYIEQSTIST
jgi:hypothetical protein